MRIMCGGMYFGRGRSLTVAILDVVVVDDTGTRVTVYGTTLILSIVLCNDDLLNLLMR
jgi:hypothetical protein